MIPLNILGHSAADLTKPLSVQDTINYYPEVTTAGASVQLALKGCHGMREFADVGSGPHRGTLNVSVNDLIYTVSGTELYSISQDGTGTLLGSIPGTGRVQITYLNAGDQYHILIVNGTAGYVWKTEDATLEQIGDEGYPGALQATFIDQYLAQVEPNGQFWFHSDLADATSYDDTNRYSAEGDPDPLVGILAAKREILVFGARTIQPYIDSGDDPPFQIYPGTFIDRGCASRHTIINLVGIPLFLADNGAVCMMDGHTATRISTHPIEQAIRGKAWDQAFAFAFEDEGHLFYVLTFPEGGTYVYDLVTSMWHRRVSYGSNRWRANTYARAFDRHIVGDYRTGKMWELTRDVFTEGGEPLISERITQFLHDNNDILFQPLMELVFDTGHGAISGQGSDPKVEFRYSDDDGNNWSDWDQASLGTTGKHGTRTLFRNLGRFRRSRAYHFRVSDPVKRDCLGATALVEKGVE